MNHQPIIADIPVPAENVLDEQTRFAEEQPLFENNGTQQVPKKKHALLIVFILLGAMLILTLLIALMARKSGVQQPVPSPSPTIELPSQGKTELQKMLDILHEDIRRSDPSVNDLPFPPINFELYIEPKTQ